MKKVLLLLGILVLVGCEPFPDKPSSSSTDSSASTESTQSAPESESESSDISYKAQKNIRISDNEVVIYQGSMNNVQTVKRVEDKDAVCWVTMNSKDWTSSISCLPRSQLSTPVEPETTNTDTKPEVQH
ncbi:hypothetical protein GAP32_465 [Cronobacter phage vB_CsaM_GAP32]|uniref:Lipoprotein n=1 Tax=Cronobacter phage vB_CsaM_GAP32 TaxID=1141136 RepID=K4F792_9CAUD|nr:hypothetical protein GAP32_465 [Cronobacter phage vB_CsaM_GAP32]AFC21923.1 hypothetical protein GAP32_465 [Cronobacter phage vB_CsaM_GAP32]